MCLCVKDINFLHKGYIYHNDDYHRRKLLLDKIENERSKYSDTPKEEYATYPDCWKQTFIVGFCGQYYVGMMISKYHLDNCLSSTSYNRGADPDVRLITYDETVINKWALSNWNTKNWKSDANTIIAMLKKEDLFDQFKIPYFLVTKEYIYTLPILKDYIKFQNVIDPQQAYQEIEMFLSQMNTNEKETASTDMNKVVSHGFDKVWSFRNPDPPKRKQK